MFRVVFLLVVLRSRCFGEAPVENPFFGAAASQPLPEARKFRKAYCKNATRRHDHKKTIRHTKPQFEIRDLPLLRSGARAARYATLLRRDSSCRSACLCFNPHLSVFGSRCSGTLRGKSEVRGRRPQPGNSSRHPRRTRPTHNQETRPETQHRFWKEEDCPCSKEDVNQLTQPDGHSNRGPSKNSRVPTSGSGSQKSPLVRASLQKLNF